MPVILLHGLFGMGGNLGVMARALVDAGYCSHQLDLPNHGRSPWIQGASIPVMAEAVNDYLCGVSPQPLVLLGHSLGGKVAMELALRYPERVAALVVADIAPVRYQGSHDAVFAAIAAVEAARPESRREAAQVMRAHLEEEGVLQFLSLSLHRGPEGRWRWRFNAQGLRDDYLNFLEAPQGDARFDGPVLFLRGERSAYVTDAGVDAARRLFPALQLVEIAETGHWLHAERPEEVNRALLSFLDGAGLSPGEAAS